MRGAGATRAYATARAVLVAPFTGRALREAMFALVGVPIGFGFLGVAFAGALAIATSRNHPPGVHLSPVPVFTPFGLFGAGSFRVTTFPGTFAALAAGAAMVLAAPWVTRAVVSVDRWLVRVLLGPRTPAQRVRDLEQTRALAVNDSAALIRQVERNLHDGAQVRLATLAMNLGMAREKLGADGEAADLAAARELLDAAHGGAKLALGELRELAKGIHPPVLDNGLADALLAASRAGVRALTPREREVLTLMAAGRSNAGVGRALVLSTGAVEKHVASIFGKLGLPASENDNRRVLAVLRYLGS